MISSLDAPKGLQWLSVLDGFIHPLSVLSLVTLDVIVISRTSCHRLCRGRGVLGLITGVPEHDARGTSANVELILADRHTRQQCLGANRKLTILATQPLTVDAAPVVNGELRTDALCNALTLISKLVVPQR